MLRQKWRGPKFYILCLKSSGLDKIHHNSILFFFSFSQELPQRRGPTWRPCLGWQNTHSKAHGVLAQISVSSSRKNKSYLVAISVII